MKSFWTKNMGKQYTRRVRGVPLNHTPSKTPGVPFWCGSTLRIWLFFFPPFFLTRNVRRHLPDHRARALHEHVLAVRQLAYERRGGGGVRGSHGSQVVLKR